MTMTETIAFDPPGPGDWMLDTTHHGRRPVTRIMQPIVDHAMDVGMGTLFAKYGLPLERARVGWVNGCMYLRMMGVGEPENPGKPPPQLVMKAIARVHPEMRRRAKTAKRVLAERTWRADTDTWFEHDRARVTSRNLAFQRVDLTDLSDHELVGHVEELLDHMAECAADGFIYHGGDLIPVGLFTGACLGWGIAPAEAASLLRGSSPATMEIDRLLAPVSRSIRAAGLSPGSIADVRDLGSEAAEQVDAWLDLHAWRLLGSDDIDSPTLAERPDLQLRAVCAAHADRETAEAPDAAPLRLRVPEAQRADFDELLAEARHGLRMRDDHVGIRWNWPAGLIRRALLEVGSRIHAADRAHDPEHAIELERSEVAQALSGQGPSADELAERAAFRDAVERAEPPLVFSSGVEAEPPFDAFPAPMATLAKGVFALISAMEGTDERPPLHGFGLGDSVVRGRACVARTAVAALEAIEPGDVLIVPFTSPSYNSLFPLVGAIVTEEGGPLSHAAIMAREFGIPAIIGAEGATGIAHGATVEIDPDQGLVRVVA